MMNRRTLLKHLSALAAMPFLFSACGRENRPVVAENGLDDSIVVPLGISHEEWRELLPTDSYAVLFEEATEPPFSSPLLDEHRTGTFICAACNQPLFSSTTKYDSGTGWPSFYESLPECLGTKKDYALLMPRTEYHCLHCGGHQGHLFNDGPAPTGKRFCNNGVALQFVPEGEQLPALRG